MTTDITTSNLGINVLGYSEYDNIQNKSNRELYVVKDANADTDNSISSRTYADVGRYAVHYGPTAPTSPLAKIWIDTTDSPVLIEPASVDIDNLSTTGVSHIQELISPNFSAGVSYSTGVGDTFTINKSGWLYVIVGASSEIELLLNDSAGPYIVGSVSGSVSTTDVKMIHHVYLPKNTTLYVNRRSGTVVLNFYPCKESV